MNSRRLRPIQTLGAGGNSLNQLGWWARDLGAYAINVLFKCEDFRLAITVVDKTPDSKALAG